MALNEICASYVEIRRISADKLSLDQFMSDFFLPCEPVIITNAVDSWNAMKKWDIGYVREKVGANKVFVRMETNQHEYRIGKKYKIKEMKCEDYIDDLLKANSRAKSSYLAVASMQRAFPQLLPDVDPLPKYVGKLHLGM